MSKCSNCCNCRAITTTSNICELKLTIFNQNEDLIIDCPQFNSRAHARESCLILPDFVMSKLKLNSIPNY